MAAEGGERKEATPASPGPGVDATGRPVVDPTENVKAIVDAAVRRLDDLRTADSNHLAEMMKLRDAHLTEMARQRADFDDKLRQAESARIDAIRAVDVGAVRQAADVASTQAATLAAQVAASADAMRLQVASTATAFEAKIASVIAPITEAVGELRQAQYQAQGQKAQVVDARGGTGTIIAAVSAGIAVVAILVAILMAFRPVDTPAPAQQTQAATPQLLIGSSPLTPTS